MKRIPFIVTVLLAISGLSACDNRAPESPAPAANTTTTTSTVAETKTETVTSPVNAASITGVPECDLYIQKYEKCINEKMTEDARATIKSGFEQQKQNWIETAKDSIGKQNLAIACGNALTIAKDVMTTAYGCEW